MASIKPYESKTGRLWRVQYRDPAGKARTMNYELTGSLRSF
mgnify:CR=1 FL=1